MKDLNNPLNNNLSTEIIHKEIDLIQSCISRMANNSFLLKGWFISLIAVILAILHEKINITLIITIITVITICFWYLDAFFLRTEKLYRELYEWVLVERPKGNNSYLYNLNPHRFNDTVPSVIKVMFSDTLFCFYFVPVILILIFFIIFNILG